MSQDSPLLVYLHTEFREALGEPDGVLEKDSQWTLRCEPKALPIFVLVNGSYEKPAVWVFDPYVAQSVWRTTITSPVDVDVSLVVIQNRVLAAAHSWQKR